MKNFLFIILLVFFGCNSKTKKENIPSVPAEIIYDFIQDSINFKIVNGEVFYKNKPFSGNLKYVDSTQNGVFVYNEKLSWGIPSTYGGFKKSTEKYLDKTYLIHRKIENKYEVIGVPDEIEFDEKWKNYFHFLYRLSLSNKDDVNYKYPIKEEVGDGIYEVIGNINISFPSGELKLFIIPPETGDFYITPLSQTLYKKYDFTKKPKLLFDVILSEYIESDTLKYYIDGKYTEYYANNNTNLSFYVNNNGKLDGEFKKFYPNGNIRFSGEFKNGKKDGLWLNYNTYGSLSKKNYKDGLIFKDCKEVAMDYLNTLGLSNILWLHDEGYVGGICTGKPNQYCGRVQKFHNGQYWTYDIVVFVEKTEDGKCKVTGTWDNL